MGQRLPWLSNTSSSLVVVGVVITEVLAVVARVAIARVFLVNRLVVVRLQSRR
jgi:hypothetical protein